MRVTASGQQAAPGLPHASQAPGDLNSSDGYSEAQSGLCTALMWPKKGWNPGASPSQAHSVHKLISASGLSLENGRGARALWRGWVGCTVLSRLQAPAAVCSAPGLAPHTHSPRPRPPPPVCAVAAIPPPSLTSQRCSKEPTRGTRLLRPSRTFQRHCLLL